MVVNSFNQIPTSLINWRDPLKLHWSGIKLWIDPYENWRWQFNRLAADSLES